MNQTGCVLPATDLDTTTADSAVVEESIKHLDEPWNVPCEYLLDPTTRCGARATWYVRCRACKQVSAQCSKHRLIEARSMASSAYDSAFCTGCHTFIAMSSWRDLFDIFPIGATP